MKTQVRHYLGWEDISTTLEDISVTFKYDVK